MSHSENDRKSRTVTVGAGKLRALTIKLRQKPIKGPTYLVRSMDFLSHYIQQ